MIKEDNFKNPPSTFKGVPFWSINDLLTEEKVREEVRALGEAGYGGAFFHAREGLVTPFLSDEWFRAFKASVEEAKRNNMYIWIYDELWWPSGFAGGLLPFSSSKYRAKAIVMISDTRNYTGEDVIASFECEVNKDGIPVSYKRIFGEKASSEKLYLTFVKYVAPIGETWYNSSSYVDLLDYETVSQFIKFAYKPYVDNFKEDIGKTIPGVFTDEPNFSASRPSHRQMAPPRGPRIPPFSLPWTNNLPAKFKEVNGYDIVENLPKLFFEIGNYQKVRHDFWKVVTLLFLESFSKQIYDWCSKNNLKFTGHYLAEDTLLSQMLCVGAVMPHYEYQHVPGIDHLGMQIWQGFLTAKQVSSVANQLGKERILCEAYGTTGNYPTFEDRKWIGDWLVVMGINLLNHHLVPYSMRGRRKKDYGLNFHWGQPWWKYNELIENHFSRLSYVLSRGERVVSVLVLHPIRSAWASYSPINDSKVRTLDDQLRGLLTSLLKLHIDFDLGDEMLMEKYAKVEGSKLKVGKASYEVLIVPPSITLAKSTLKLLKEFKNAGGKVVFVKPLPSLVDGEESEELLKFIESCIVKNDFTTESLRDILEESSKTLVIEGDEEGNLVYHLRKDSNNLVLFVFNSSREKVVDAKVGIIGSYSISLLDTFSGSITEFEGYEKDGRTYFEYTFGPVSSLLLSFSPGKPKRKEYSLKEVSKLAISSEWKVKKLNPNVLVLDYCKYKTKGDWSELLPVWKARRQIVNEGLGTSFTLKFEFEVKTNPKDKNIKLAMETPQLFNIKLNGKEVEWKDEGFWIDDSIRVMNITSYLREGKNEVELEGSVGIEPELENLFLIGDFGVKLASRGASTIVEESIVKETSNLVSQGYPFYVGSFELSNKFLYNEEVSKKTITLKLEGLKASLAIVYVNDQEVGKSFIYPFSLDITKFVKKGENNLRIKLIGTLRNALGPLHYAGGDPAWIGPEQFEDERHWTDDYILKPLGLEKVEVVTSEKVS
ncbi:MAG: glycosyl hydrolase [Thermoproteota archaeon]